MDLTFNQIMVTIIVASISIMAVKISFSFDINKFLEARKERLRQKIKNYCPHMVVKKTKEGKIGIRSSFISPYGTTDFQCEICGLIRSYVDEEEEKVRAKYFLEHPEEYFKQEKAFNKILKKMGFL